MSRLSSRFGDQGKDKPDQPVRGPVAPGRGVPPPPPPAGPVPPQRPAIAAVRQKVQEEEIRSRIDRLPAFPTVVHEVIRLAGDPKSNARDFERQIQRDQVLTARMLRLVNSSFYGLRNKITRISLAVVILGTKTLKSLVFAATASSVLSRKQKGYGYDEAGLWRHSFVTAAASRKVAEKVGFDKESCEEMFVQGLLHDIGKLVLGSFVSQRMDEFHARGTSGIPCEVCETELLGHDHAAVGGRVAEQWRLSEPLREAIAAHHDPLRTETYRREAAVLALANFITNSLRIGFAVDHPFRHPLPETAVRVLGLSAEHIKGLQEYMAQEMENIEELLTQLSG